MTIKPDSSAHDAHLRPDQTAVLHRSVEIAGCRVGKPRPTVRTRRGVSHQTLSRAAALLSRGTATTFAVRVAGGGVLATDKRRCEGEAEPTLRERTTARASRTWSAPTTQEALGSRLR